jgi:hypothetical protein
LGNWRQAALVRPSETAIGDPYFLKKIPRPPPLRFRLDDDGLTLFPDEHFRSIESVIFWQSDSLRTTGCEKFGCIHCRYSIYARCLIKVSLESANKGQCLPISEKKKVNRGLRGYHRL